MKKPNDEPAFPAIIPPVGFTNHSGMTLRDYFAAQAMCGFCFGSDVDSFGVKESAAQAYAIADAMLAERSKND